MLNLFLYWKIRDIDSKNIYKIRGKIPIIEKINFYNWHTHNIFYVKIKQWNKIFIKNLIEKISEIEKKLKKNINLEYNIIDLINEINNYTIWIWNYYDLSIE